MRAFLTRCAVAAMTLTAATVVASSPANAAVPVLQVTAANGVQGGAGCSHPTQANGAILNGTALTTITVGAIHLWDCNYGQGNYDILVAGGHWTSEQGWNQTAGVYIGAGYCTQLRHQVGAEWPRYNGADPCGPVQIFFPDAGIKRIDVYRR